MEIKEGSLNQSLARFKQKTKPLVK